MKKIKVLIVDDMPQVRQDLRTFLNLTLDIEVVGEAANGIEAIRQTEILKPDVILMDLEMPQLDGYQASRKIKLTIPNVKSSLYPSMVEIPNDSKLCFVGSIILL